MPTTELHHDPDYGWVLGCGCGEPVGPGTGKSYYVVRLDDGRIMFCHEHCVRPAPPENESGSFRDTGAQQP